MAIDNIFSNDGLIRPELVFQECHRPNGWTPYNNYCPDCGKLNPNFKASKYRKITKTNFYLVKIKAGCGNSHK